jgi:hypothetical protein
MFGQYSPGGGYPGQSGFIGAVFKSLSGAVASAGSLARSTSRTVSAAVTPAAAIVVVLARRLQGTAASAGSLAKSTARALSGGALTPSATIATLKVRLVSLAATVASAGTLTQRTLFRALTGVVGSAGSIRKSIRRVLSGMVAAIGALARRPLTQTTVLVRVSGEDRTGNIRLGSLDVEDVLNDEPNRATFTCADWTPLEGEVVIITRGPDEEIEFAGHIVSVQQFYEGILANVAYFVTCQDYTWKLNRRLVTKRWRNTSATTIAQEIISGFSSGFTSAGVASGLATQASFECESERPSDALRRLAAEIGGSWYVDYELDLHFFLTEATDAPEDISDVTLATTTARGLAHTGDLSQARTRIRATGGGSTAAEHMVAGSGQLPLEEGASFETAGGSLRTSRGPNIGTYTGKHDGGVSATVLGNVAGPGSAPSAAVASGVVGILDGDYQYKVAFANAQGETTPSSASGTVNCAAVAVPVLGSAQAAASGVIGPLIGAYLYVLTYVTALGETTGSSSFGRTAVAVAAPGAPTVNASGDLGYLIGAYNYRVTFVTPFGETEGGTVGGRTATAVSTPSSPSSAEVSATMGKLIGAYGWKVTTVDAYGESAASTASTLSPAAQTAPAAPTVSTTSAGTDNGPLRVGQDYQWKVAFVGPNGHETLGTASSVNTPAATTAAAPAISGDGTGNSIRIRVAWRSRWGESAWSDLTTDSNHGATVTVTPTSMPTDADEWVMFSTGSYTGTPPTDYFRMPFVYQGTGSGVLSGTGILATAGGGTMGKKANLTSIPTGPTGTVARRIYRTKGGGSIYYLVGEIPDNSSTTWTDALSDDSLSIAAPTTNLNGKQVSLTSISTGATGTTKRRIYRTKAGGSVYYLLDEILDNSTTTYTDNKADSELNLAITAPSAATTGQQHALTSIQTGPSGTTARRIYRTTAGGSIYYLLHELADNVTTSYTDNKRDSELLAITAPAVSTAGGQVHSLTAIPIGPTGTLARRIYRTIAGGTSYQFVGELTDNTAQTFTDDRADEELGSYVPVVNTAGANKVTVSSIPTGGSSVTKRILYRTEDGGTTFKYLATINDNVTTTYTDNTPDTSLGREALTQSTIGAVAGDTSLLLSTVTGWPTSGWFRFGGQLLRYTGISSTTLTGIPGARATTITRSGTTATATTTGSHGFATGELVTIQGAEQPEYNGRHIITVTGATTYTVPSSPATPATGTITTSAVGAILASIPGGSGVVTAPFLSGVSGLTYAVEQGAPVRIYVVRNDTSAQTALAALEGGDGIHEASIDDPTITSVAQLTAAADAELAAWSTKLRTVTFQSRDPKLRSGKTVTLSLGAPTNLSGSFLIQRVISSEFDAAPGLNPMRTVIAAPVRLSFQDVLRRRQ